MANYIKSTNFTSKDTLPTGDPLKKVKGTEIDIELNAIATAIASKADSVNPSFTGTPFSPTATFGTSTNQIATTAFVQAALQALHPVGSIYINATNSANPATYFGFGTWVAFGAGRVPVGFNASDPLFDSAEETGGSKDAVVVSHTHTATSTVTDPGHKHFFDEGTGLNPGAYSQPSPSLLISNGLETKTATTGITVSTSISTEGSSGTNANLQPYITVYMWKRTA